MQTNLRKFWNKFNELGPSGSLFWGRELLFSWNLPKQERQGRAGSGTSLSDADEFISICKAAYQNDQIFERFRRNRQYRTILEHVTWKQGKKYQACIKNLELYSQIFPALRRQGKVGGPFRYRYKPIGYISPTQLRYLKVLDDLHNMYGSLSGFKIGEIGIGFGGQAAVILSFYDDLKYHFYDLPEVLDLASKFLSVSNVVASPTKNDGRSPIPTRFDLVISNYAFSELSRKVQDLYIENVLSETKHAYITWNELSHSKLDGYSLDKILELFPLARLIDEVPLTAPGNTIIYW